MEGVDVIYPDNIYEQTLKETHHLTTAFSRDAGTAVGQGGSENKG